MKLKIAACQILTYPDLNESVSKIISWISQAVQEGVDVIVFPEAALCGYCCDSTFWENTLAEHFLDAEIQIMAAAKKHDIAVVLGSAHWENGEWYNCQLIIDKGGNVRGRYAKTHLAENWPVPGKEMPVYSLAGVKSCFLICHDIRYPELVRLPAIAGAQICYYSSNESGLTMEYKFSAYRAMPISRAAENAIFVVMANAPANQHNLNSPSQSHGNSKIIDPDGNILVEAGHFEERLVTAIIDTDDSTNWVAKRAANDETILKSWLNSGVKLVSVGDT